MENRTEVRLSIIIPVYNGKQYLKKLFDSMQKLESCEPEILLVDDCSEDESGTYCRELAKINPNVRVLEKERREGIAASRNLGLKHARGRYVCFIDQDDKIEPGVYLKALHSAEEHQTECCLWATRLVFEDGRQEKDFSFPAEKTYEETEIRQALLEQYLRKDDSKRIFKIPGHVWAGMFLKDFLEKNGIFFFSFVDYEDDCVFMNQVMRHCKKLTVFPDAGYYWTRNLKSESHRVKYIEDFWKKSTRLKDWYQSAIYDIFSGETPPLEKLQKEEAVKIYEYVENLCSIKNPAPRTSVIKELSQFFSVSHHYDAISEEKPPYGGAGKRRQILRKLILARRYGTIHIFLRMYRRINILKTGS